MFRKLLEVFVSRSMTSVEQPDPRISLEGLGTFPLDGKRYVSHAQSGCPRNACIEYFKADNHLRCGFCFKPLTHEAAIHVLTTSKMTEANDFVWTE